MRVIATRPARAHPHEWDECVMTRGSSFPSWLCFSLLPFIFSSLRSQCTTSPAFSTGREKRYGEPLPKNRKIVSTLEVSANIFAYNRSCAITCRYETQNML